MEKIPVWMDCDTGTDDAVAILAAHALDRLALKGISAVCGNTCQRNAFLNTHRVCGLIGAKTPVYPGAEDALLRTLSYAEAFHGKNGLGDADIPLPKGAVFREEKAWDALYRAAKKEPGSLRLVTTGPLTNAATAFSKYPDLPSLLHSVYMMGGSATAGNVTPAAEFNVYADPQAAEIVLRSGAPIYMFGLNATLQEWFTPEDLEELAATGTKCGRFVHDILQVPMKNHLKCGRPGAAMHDSCPVMYLVHPEYFKTEETGVHVETRGSITTGKTVTDLYSDKQFPVHNVTIATGIDREPFIRMLKALILQHG